VSQNPSIGRIVHYTLTDHDAEQVNRRRDDATRSQIAGQNSGAMVHYGNGVRGGEVYPLVITRVWGTGPGAAVNGQVLLDGNDTLWVTSVTEGEGARFFQWPTRG
jgi:hypothetical protein